MTKGRQPNETFDEYRTRVIDPTIQFVAQNGIMLPWLGHGGTASCHPQYR